MMRYGAMVLGCAWVLLAAGGTQAQEPSTLPESIAAPQGASEHSHAATAHGHGREVTAEDVPDHEPVHHTRWRVRSEYVMWLIKQAQAPPLLTTGLNTDPRPGVIGSASGRVIYGGKNIELNERHGGLFSIGYSFDDEDCLSMEAIYGFAGAQRVGFNTSSPGSTAAFPVLARPFLDVVNNREEASLIAFPGLAAGTVDIRIGTYFDTGELNLSRKLLEHKEKRLDFTGGLRIFRLEETLSIQEAIRANPAALQFGGRTITVSDLFETDNTFYGGQIGLRGFLHRKRWELELGAKIALGIVDRESRVSGATFIDTNPATAVPAGLLALSSNQGRFSSSEFSFLPEGNVRLGYRFTENFQVSFGYTFLYLDQVLRPGDQIDRNLNPNLIPTSVTFGAPGGPARPAPVERSSDFWVHGLRFGLELKF